MAETSNKKRSETALAVDEQTVWFDKAMAQFHARNFQKAKELFEKALTGPLLEITHAARVHTNICEQRTQRSAPMPTSADEHYTYAVALINQRRLDEAQKHLESALKLAPASDHVLYALALCRGLKGDYQQARDNLKKAIELHPKNRAQARSDPDFAEIIHQPLIAELLFPEKAKPA